MCARWNPDALSLVSLCAPRVDSSTMVSRSLCVIACWYAKKSSADAPPAFPDHASLSQRKCRMSMVALKMDHAVQRPIRCVRRSSRIGRALMGGGRSNPVMLGLSHLKGSPDMNSCLSNVQYPFPGPRPMM